MKRIIYTALCVFVVGITTVNAQKQDQVKLVYAKSTEASLKELGELTKGNPAKKEEVLLKINELEKQGKIFLSTKEYAPIKIKIAGPVKNAEEQAYNDRVKANYVVITELLK